MDVQEHSWLSNVVAVQKFQERQCNMERKVGLAVLARDTRFASCSELRQCVMSEAMPDNDVEHSNVRHLPRARPSAHRYPGVAVCMSGTCSDAALARRTADALMGQDYRGSIVLMIPEGTATDRQWVRPGIEKSRQVILCPRADGSCELDCNAAFALALELRPSVEYIALLKFGEVPPPQWLSVMMTAQREFDADLVVGPVKAVFDEAPSDWMLSGTSFDRFGILRGPIPRIPAADNLLIRADVIRSCLPRVFAPRPVPRESEWTDFAYRAEALGFASICANDAVVFDVVPKSRMTKEWIISREYDKALADVRARSLYKTSRLPDTARRLRACGLIVSSLMSCGWAWFDEGRLLRARLKLAQAQAMMARDISRESIGKEAV